MTQTGKCFHLEYRLYYAAVMGESLSNFVFFLLHSSVPRSYRYRLHNNIVEVSGVSKLSSTNLDLGHVGPPTM